MTSDPKKPREIVVGAGRARLLRHPFDPLRSQLNASSLASISPVSRDTAYRVFRDDRKHRDVTDAIVAAVGEAANDPAWTGFQDAVRESLAAYRKQPRQPGDRHGAKAAILAAFRANYEGQFRARGLPVMWVLQAAALTSSPAWQGERPASEDDVELGREILEQRRRFYRAATRQMTSFLTMAMSEVGRRPRRGFDPESVVRLLHALHDGAVLRNLVDPGAFPPELVAEAMYRLAEVLTEEGPLTDPRRPTDERGGQVFDRLLEAAEDLWRSQPEITVEEAAGRAGVSVEAGGLLFPTVGDLADSLLRARVVGGGFTDIGPLPGEVEMNQRLVGLVTELRSLRDFVDGCPHALAASRAHPPKESAPFLEDFVDNESRVLAALGVSHDPAQFIRDLVGFASKGRGGWPTVIALLRTLGYQDE